MSRNDCIFNDFLPSIRKTIVRCLNFIKAYPVKVGFGRNRIIGCAPVLKAATSFFDGAGTKMVGGAGDVLFIKKDHYFYIRLGCGYCTNSRAELLALWGLLFVAHVVGLQR